MAPPAVAATRKYLERLDDSTGMASSLLPGGSSEEDEDENEEDEDDDVDVGKEAGSWVTRIMGTRPRREHAAASVRRAAIAAGGGPGFSPPTQRPRAKRTAAAGVKPGINPEDTAEDTSGDDSSASSDVLGKYRDNDDRANFTDDNWQEDLPVDEAAQLFNMDGAELRAGGGRPATKKGPSSAATTTAAGPKAARKRPATASVELSESSTEDEEATQVVHMGLGNKGKTKGGRKRPAAVELSDPPTEDDDATLVFRKGLGKNAKTKTKPKADIAAQLASVASGHSETNDVLLEYVSVKRRAEERQTLLQEQQLQASVNDIALRTEQNRCQADLNAKRFAFDRECWLAEHAAKLEERKNARETAAAKQQMVNTILSGAGTHAEKMQLIQMIQATFVL